MNTPENIDQVIVALERIVQTSLERSEREGYFAALYLRVTRAVKQKIEDGFFDDNTRMEKLDVVFANRYLMAYEQYKNGQPCSTSWRLAFDACARWQPLVLQHLFLGMNAHIGLDLGVAAATICPGDSIQSLQNDFNKINSVLAGLVNTVQNEIKEFWLVMRVVDALLGHSDEAIAKFSIDIARDAAWKVALDYAPLTNPTPQQEFISARDVKVAAFGAKLARPGLLLATAVAAMRIFETGSVKEKMAVLNER